MRIQNEHFCDTKICVEDKRKTSFIAGTTFEACQVEIRVPGSALVIRTTTFKDCTIHAKQQLTNFRWSGAKLTGCTFRGRFRGNDFGYFPYDDEPFGREPFCGIENCDFREAKLAGCRFFGCDMDTITLPTWPCFTILNPSERADDIKQIKWPGDLKVIMQAYGPPHVGWTEDALELVKKYNVTEDELKACLDQLRGVVC